MRVAVPASADRGPVLVTGGLGFIGSHIVEALLAAGRPVRILDHEPESPFTRVPEGAELVRADLRDGEAVGRAVRDVTAVSHQASMVGLGVDFDDVTRYVEHNDLATAVLLRALAASRFRGRLVVASSMVVYGEGRYACARHGPVPAPPRSRQDLDAGRWEPVCPVCDARLEPESVPEDAPADPRNIYAATKLHQEHLAVVYGRELAVPVVRLRYHNVYGPHMPRDTPYAGVASIFRSALEAGQAPQVFEDGGQRRDFVHVRDVAEANLRALSHDAPSGAYNVASGEPHTIGEMAAALAGALRPDLPPVVTGGYRLGDVRHVFASTDRATAELGFTARTSFDDGIAEFARTPLRAPALPAGRGDRYRDDRDDVRKPVRDHHDRREDRRMLDQPSEKPR